MVDIHTVFRTRKTKPNPDPKPKVINQCRGLVLFTQFLGLVLTVSCTKQCASTIVVMVSSSSWSGESGMIDC